MSLFVLTYPDESHIAQVSPYLGVPIDVCHEQRCSVFDLRRWLGSGFEQWKTDVTAPPPPPPEEDIFANKKSEKFVVVAGGDVDLSGGVSEWILADPAHNPFEKIAPLLEGAHFKFANLVSPITAARPLPRAKGRPPRRIAPPNAARSISAGGIDLVTFSSEHAWDAGHEGFKETLDQLEAADVWVAGASHRAGDANKAFTLEAEGWKVALFVANAVEFKGPREKKESPGFIADGDRVRLIAAIKKARKTYDIILVSYHGGEEYADIPSEEHQSFAHVVMRAGADAVLSHHSHIATGFGWYKKRPIFYGLGNLVRYDDPKHPWTSRGFFTRLTFYPDGRRDVEICPYILDEEEPIALAGENRRQQEGIFRRTLKRLSHDLGGTTISEPALHSCMRIWPRALPTSHVDSGTDEDPATDPAGSAE